MEIYLLNLNLQERFLLGLKNDNHFIIIGSLWKNLEFNLTDENKDFYKFLLENGLGEKNSLKCNN